MARSETELVAIVMEAIRKDYYAVAHQPLSSPNQMCRIVASLGIAIMNASRSAQRGSMTILGLLPLIAALLAGVAMSTQPMVNAQLARSLGGQLQAGLFSIVISTIVLVALCLVFRAPLPLFSVITRVPQPTLIGGGILGATIMLLVLYSGPRIGSGAMMALIISGQLLSAFLFDHFGFFDLPVHSISALRVLGAGAVVAGTLLIILT